MTEIVNISKQNAIGRAGELIVHLKEDMAFFRAATKGKVCVMGRPTLESFPRMAPLKDRVNIVLTRDSSRIRPESVAAAQADKAAGRSTELIFVFSMEEALEKLKAYPKEDIFIIGGADIYQKFLPYCSRCLITENDAEPENADAFFPTLPAAEWTLSDKSEEKEENGVRFHFCTYTRTGEAKPLCALRL